MAKQFKLSKENLELLTNELDYLKSVREREVAEQVKEARSFGDLSENSEYDEAKNEQGKLYSRIAELEMILSNYIIIDEDSLKADEVSVGCSVVVEDMDDGSVETYQIVGSLEADPSQGRISEESPFGKAVIGKKIGQVAHVEAPAGELKYLVKKISI